MKIFPRDSKPHSPVADDTAFKDVATERVWEEQLPSCTPTAPCTARTPWHQLSPETPCCQYLIKIMLPFALEHIPKH